MTRVMWMEDRMAQWIKAKAPAAWNVIDVVLMVLYALLRFMAGSSVATDLDKCNRPQKPLILYEFEGSWRCAVVREAMSVLDIDYECRPCPRTTMVAYGVVDSSSRFRAEAVREGGKAMFPFIIDPNPQEKVKMYGCNEIVSYLWKTYGEHATAPNPYTIANNPKVFRISFFLASLCRPCMDMGVLRTPSKAPEKPLEIWCYEPTPFGRRVREKLATLELPHIMHTMAKGSSKRPAFKKAHENEIATWRLKSGRLQVPFMYDPNTEKSMFESSDIVKYLEATYQKGAFENQSWLSYTLKGKSD